MDIMFLYIMFISIINFWHLIQCTISWIWSMYLCFSVAKCIIVAIPISYNHHDIHLIFTTESFQHRGNFLCNIAPTISFPKLQILNSLLVPGWNHFVEGKAFSSSASTFWVFVCQETFGVFVPPVRNLAIDTTLEKRNCQTLECPLFSSTLFITSRGTFQNLN